MVKPTQIKITTIMTTSGEAYHIEDDVVGTRIFEDIFNVIEYILKLNGKLDNNHVLQIVER